MNSKIDVLDHGSVELLSYMGSDDMILETARVCTGEIGNPARNKGLMDYLIRNEHETPLECSVFRFKVKAPIFVARQWVKHRMSSWNEKSARYTDFGDMEYYIPEVWNKETGRGKVTPHINPSVGMLARDELKSLYNEAIDGYEDLVSATIAKEQARLIMPVGAYTEWVWTVNLRSLLNFFKLRTSEHAQMETREYALAIKELVESTGDFDNAMSSINGMIALDYEIKRFLNEIKDPKIGAEVLGNLIDSM